MLPVRISAAAISASRRLSVLARHTAVVRDQRRGRLLWKSEVKGPEIPVGAAAGHPEDPERHTFDGDYRGHPEHGDPHHEDYVYRRPHIGSTYIDRQLSKYVTAFFWAWVTYHMYYNSGMLFGHWYAPYLEEFTDEELGIPPDDYPEQPEYWGNHGKPYGTYR